MLCIYVGMLSWVLDAIRVRPGSYPELQRNTAKDPSVLHTLSEVAALKWTPRLSVFKIHEIQSV